MGAHSNDVQGLCIDPDIACMSDQTRQTRVCIYLQESSEYQTQNSVLVLSDTIIVILSRLCLNRTALERFQSCAPALPTVWSKILVTHIEGMVICHFQGAFYDKQLPSL